MWRQIDQSRLYLEKAPTTALPRRTRPSGGCLGSDPFPIYTHSSCPGQKWQITGVGQKHFFQPMRWGSVPPGGPRFFLSCWGEGGVVGLLLVSNVFPWSSKCVPIKFSMGSQYVSKVSQWVPQHVLNSSLLYSISSALSSCNQPKPAPRMRLHHIYFGEILHQKCKCWVTISFFKKKICFTIITPQFMIGGISPGWKW